MLYHQARNYPCLYSYHYIIYLVWVILQYNFCPHIAADTIFLNGSILILQGMYALFSATYHFIIKNHPDLSKVEIQDGLPAFEGWLRRGLHRLAVNGRFATTD